MANKADLSIGIVAVAPSPATSGLTLELEGGQGDDMPEVPFKALAYPQDVIPTRYNSERVLVTARTDDELTIERGIGVTTAQPIDVGWIVSNNIFADDFLGSISDVAKEVPVGSINGTNKLFYTDEPYIGGSLQGYVNGLAQGNFITETDPSLGEFEFDVAPLTGDDVFVSYQFALSAANNADTVDGYHAAATPSANKIPVFDSNTQLPDRNIFKEYSTSEINTGNKWVDGKTIYRKTINFGAMPNSTTKSVSHGISGLSAVLNIYGWATNGTNYITVPRGAPAGTNSIESYANSTDVMCVTSANWTAYSSSYITLEYTK